MKLLNIVKKINSSAIAISILFVTSSFNISSTKPHNNPPINSLSKVKVICLDAGHGGHDFGAVGRKSNEKDLNLEVVLKLGKRIEEELPGVKVIYTRTTDVYPKLYERPALANKHKADLFISVHCNSADRDVRVRNSRGKYVNSVKRNPQVRGTETLVCGINRTNEQDVAIRENASILLEENYQDNYNGFDPKDPSSYIVFKLMKRQYRDQSIRLATYIQNQYAASARGNRGVKEQGLAVLATAAMPAVLTELGFISSPEEEEFMMSTEGQREIVDNLFQAIKTYKNNVEK
ncbi:N-acetylmuramoyl-L-alanine amidase family protein [Sphingobacterium rhinopitheci]|uniref:N-acetylmuramoyl-L-alanine amidase family protein n=1 Tax=Sphingobacterium rhinopitheci TaxID=2781960 RepID=UPI001F523C20|nr:N-acetylmuramoyl-L-alanine amidase [Sphingobacterium rhinopitheci]MCI0920174.1 N-acetylmuramoyl-L-alanine amidase [Sphingobacterium rhinopitheci]